MSVKIIFRNSLPPLIHKSFPNSNIDYFEKIAKPLQKRDSILNNSETRRDSIEEIFKELDNMIGLSLIKKFIHELQAFVEIQKKREKENLITEPLVLHMIFSGNPGSGKTSVARLISKLFREMGVLQKGHIIECERADLVGEYIGHTANKTRNLIKKALGGVLFIDEAYSLARGGEKDFGKEAIDTLVKAMEDNKENLIIILAGYRIEMDAFIQANPGLRSRFPIHICFPDYSIDELVLIGELMLSKRQYEFSPQSKIAFRNKLQQRNLVHPYSGNARMVRNIIEKTIRKQAVRLYNEQNLSRKDLMGIIEADLCNEDI